MVHQPFDGVGFIVHGKSVNHDPAALVLDTFFKLQETAAGLAR